MRSTKEILEEAFRSHEGGNLDEAGRIYDRLLGHTAGEDPSVLYAYGCLLIAWEKPGLALHCFTTALKLAPHHAPSWVNLGMVLKQLDRDQAALWAYGEAQKLEPRNDSLLINLAGWYVNRGMPEKVIEYATQAIEVAPDNPRALNHMALGLLEAERYAEAWKYFDARWNLPEKIANRRPYQAPLWRGEKVGLLAIHGEQGLGDEIMFMGAFKEAAKRADRVVIECAAKLKPLFHRSFGVHCYTTHDELIAEEGEPDAYISMGSLFGIVGLPDGSAYLKPETTAKFTRPTIGIAWKGGTPKTNKNDRSLKLDMLRPILDIPGLRFKSVQYGAEADPQFDILPTDPGDFQQITADIAACDLVISVCQTAVHQAGAMGIPCWVMTPKRCAWRYAGTDERMRWYNSVRLFRQGDDEKWQPVIERIADELRSRYASLAA